MEKARKRSSMVRLFAELVEESIILVFLEMKLALFEVKKHIRSAEKGTVMMALGAALLLFALVTFVGTAVAALAVILPVWLSALIVALALTFCGVAFLFSGLGNLKDFSFIPSETLLRVQNIVQKLTVVSAQHKAAEKSMAPEAGSAPERRVAPERRMAYERRTVRLGHVALERRNAPERRATASARRSSASPQRPGRSELKQKAA
jgi:hypothetical protein